jgi:hypothetical protein
MRCLATVARAALRLWADLILGPDPLPPGYVSPTTGRPR